MDRNCLDKARPYAMAAVRLFERYEAPARVVFLESKFSCLLYGDSELQHVPGNVVPDTIWQMQ